MPGYDLRCTVCGGEFKVYASMADKAEKRVPCPNCGNFDLETVFKAAPAFIKSSGGSQPFECPNRDTCGGCAGPDWD